MDSRQGRHIAVLERLKYMDVKAHKEFNTAMTITKLEALFKISGLANISRALDLFHKMEQPGSTHWRSLVRGFQWDLIVC